MAQQYDFGGNNDFKERTKNKEEKYKIWNAVTIVLVILLFVVPIFISANSTDGFSSDQSEYYDSAIIELCLFVAFLFSTAQGHKNNPESEKVSITGNRDVARSLNSLNNNYIILSNLCLYYKNDKTLYDFIVISPKSIHVIVTNNRNGYIYGTRQDQNWTQHKVGRKGGEYDKYFKNPINKLYFQKQFLSEALYADRFVTKIFGYVFFPMAEKVKCEDFEVATDKNNLLTNIINDNYDMYSESDIEYLISILKKLSKNENISVNLDNIEFYPEHNSGHTSLDFPDSQKSAEDKTKKNSEKFPADIRNELILYDTLKKKGINNLSGKELKAFSELSEKIKKYNSGF